MTYRTDLRARHRTLRRLEAVEDMHVDTIRADDTPSTYPEEEIVCRNGPRNTVPPAVDTLIDSLQLNIAEVKPHNNPDYRWSLVR